MSKTFTNAVERVSNAADRRDAAAALDRRGWTNIGAGVFGAAYSHPECPDVVLKVFWDDSAYRAYLTDVVLPLQGRNPHVPTVHAWRPIGQNGGVVVLERLERVDYSDDDKGEIRVKVATVCREGQASAKVRGIPRDLVRIGNRIHATIERERVRRERGVTSGRNREPGVDLHGGNVMLRGDTLVITDPLAW